MKDTGILEYWNEHGILPGVWGGLVEASTWCNVKGSRNKYERRGRDGGGGGGEGGGKGGEVCVYLFQISFNYL